MSRFLTIAPVMYWPDFIDKVDADFAFNHLWTKLDWLRIGRTPRREYYVAKNNQPYTYGKPEFARTYQSQPLDPVIDRLWRYLEAIEHVSYDAVFLNGYEDGNDHLGWHSDDSPEMDDTRPIAIITLGQERVIHFRLRPEVAPENRDVDRLHLRHGSLCIMKPGMQDRWQHRIPKAGFQPCEPRVSLTFRGIVR